MRVLVSGDPHLGLDKPGSARRKAVASAFDWLLSALTKHRIADAFMHTGDFVDGPSIAPTLDTDALQSAMCTLVTNRCNILKCPKGNHDIPKKGWDAYPTLWQTITMPGESNHDRIIPLSFHPDGQEANEAQFMEALASLPLLPPGPKLLVAHALWDRDFEVEGKLTHENWFRSEWCRLLADAPGGPVTVYLGHDHAPRNIVQFGVNVYIVGSPTTMTHGDSRPRRALVWNDVTGGTTEIKLPTFLKQSTLTELNEDIVRTILMDPPARIYLDVELGCEADLFAADEFAQRLQDAGVEVKNSCRVKTSVDRAALEELKSDHAVPIVVAWSEWQQDDEMRELGLHYIREVAREVED